MTIASNQLDLVPRQLPAGRAHPRRSDRGLSAPSGILSGTHRRAPAQPWRLAGQATTPARTRLCLGERAGLLLPVAAPPPATG